MKVRTKRKICAAVAGISFVFVWATACASDANQIPILQTLIQTIVGTVTCALSLHKGGFLHR